MTGLAVNFFDAFDDKGEVICPPVVHYTLTEPVSEGFRAAELGEHRTMILAPDGPWRLWHAADVIVQECAITYSHWEGIIASYQVVQHTPTYIYNASMPERIRAALGEP